MRFALYLIIVLFYLNSALADDYHYREILVGERAAGLGGAFVALSDDPSGIWYNPAGILFSNENYFSLSANAYVTTTEVYKKAVANGDYSYKSGGLVPSFFGFTQNFGKYKWGFALVVPNSDLIDQEDLITIDTSTTSRPYYFKRKFFRQNNITSAGVAFAGEFIRNFSIGLSLFGSYHIDKFIDNQIIKYRADSTGNEMYFFEDRTYSKTVISLTPKLGIQWMPKKFVSLGATVSKDLIASARSNFSRYYSDVNTDGTPKTPTNGIDLTESTIESSTGDPAPITFALGAAYFPNSSFLITTDFYYYLSDSTKADFTTINTWNLSFGSEYYLSDKSALRAGFFTNNANTFDVQEGKTSQSPHVDMYGVTLSYSLLSPGSSFTVGTIYSMGKGKGQVISDSTVINDVERSTVSFYVTGSYQL